MDAPQTRAPSAPAAQGVSTPRAEVGPAAHAERSVAMPAAAACETEGASTRCPEEILLSAAMSWLDKTSAEFDGTTMVVVEHDPELLMEEAHEDPAFCRFLVDADVGPSDGELDRAEALAVEARVLQALEARYAMAQ